MEFDPNKNHDAISIIRQEDGNYKGFQWKFGKLIEVREVKPEDCILKLLTHDGTQSQA